METTRFVSVLQKQSSDMPNPSIGNIRGTKHETIIRHEGAGLISLQLHNKDTERIHKRHLCQNA